MPDVKFSSSLLVFVDIVSKFEDWSVQRNPVRIQPLEDAIGITPVVIVAVLETTVTEVVDGDKDVLLEFSANVSFIDNVMGAVCGCCPPCPSASSST